MRHFNENFKIMFERYRTKWSSPYNS